MLMGAIAAAIVGFVFYIDWDPSTLSVASSSAYYSTSRSTSPSGGSAGPGDRSDHPVAKRLAAGEPVQVG